MSISTAMAPVCAATTTKAALDLLTANEINQAQTGHFYENTGALVNRFSDRVFIAGAVANNGNASAAGAPTDWLDAYQIAYPLTPTIVSQVVSLTDDTGFGEVAILGGARSKYHTNSYQSAIGIGGYSYNDNITLGSGSWCFYGEGYRLNDTVGRTYGMELCVINQSGQVHLVNPYDVPSGATICVQYDSGNGFGRTQQPGLAPSSAVMVFFQNTNDSSSPFKSGIVVLANAIDLNTNNFSEVLSMPALSGLQWYTPGQSPASYIKCTTTDPTLAGQIELRNNGIAFTAGAANSPLALFASNSPAAVNFLEFQNAASGGAPAILAVGNDPNVPLVLAAQGNAAVTSVSNVRPSGDNTLSCGVNGAAWNAVYTYSVINPSDPKLKKNIAPLSAEMALTILRTVDPITFEWKEGDDSSTHFGYNALHIEAATPRGLDWGAFIRDKDGRLFYRPEEMQPVIHKSTQALDAEVIALKAMVAKLVTEVKDLKEGKHT